MSNAALGLRCGYAHTHTHTHEHTCTLSLIQIHVVSGDLFRERK